MLATGETIRQVLPHARSPEEVARELGSDPDQGLNREAAARRLAEGGPNRLPSPERPAYAAIALRQLADPLVALLLRKRRLGGHRRAARSCGDSGDRGPERGAGVLPGGRGRARRARAPSSVQPTAAVVRDGREHQVPAEELVPGDLVVLREGDRVPADARLVAARRLELDESALTGESVPVTKDANAVAPETPLAERTSMTFAGTGVTRGRGRALVTATGAATEVGTIASSRRQRSRRRRRCSGASGGSHARWSYSGSESPSC